MSPVHGAGKSAQAAGAADLTSLLLKLAQGGGRIGHTGQQVGYITMQEGPTTTHIHLTHSCYTCDRVSPKHCLLVPDTANLTNPQADNNNLDSDLVYMTLATVGKQRAFDVGA